MCALRYMRVQPYMFTRRVFRSMYTEQHSLLYTFFASPLLSLFQSLHAFRILLIVRPRPSLRPLFFPSHSPPFFVLSLHLARHMLKRLLQMLLTERHLPDRPDLRVRLQRLLLLRVQTSTFQSDDVWRGVRLMRDG